MLDFLTGDTVQNEVNVFWTANKHDSNALQEKLRDLTRRRNRPSPLLTWLNNPGSTKSAAAGSSQSAAAGSSQSATEGSSQSAVAGSSKSTAAGSSSPAAAGSSTSSVSSETAETAVQNVSDESEDEGETTEGS